MNTATAPHHIPLQPTPSLRSVVHHQSFALTSRSFAHLVRSRRPRTGAPLVRHRRRHAPTSHSFTPFTRTSRAMWSVRISHLVQPDGAREKRARGLRELANERLVGACLQRWMTERPTGAGIGWGGMWCGCGAGRFHCCSVVVITVKPNPPRSEQIETFEIGHSVIVLTVIPNTSLRTERIFRERSHQTDSSTRSRIHSNCSRSRCCPISVNE